MNWWQVSEQKNKIAFFDGIIIFIRIVQCVWCWKKEKCFEIPRPLLSLPKKNPIESEIVLLEYFVHVAVGIVRLFVNNLTHKIIKFIQIKIRKQLMHKTKQVMKLFQLSRVLERIESFYTPAVRNWKAKITNFSFGYYWIPAQFRPSYIEKSQKKLQLRILNLSTMLESIKSGKNTLTLCQAQLT